MSPDWLILAPLAVGHFALFVLTVNVTHAFGHRKRTMGRITLALLLIYMAISAALAWEAWSGPVLAWSWPSLVYVSVCVLTGVLVLPTVTAYLHHRPRPRDIVTRASEIDLAAGRDVAAFMGQGKLAWMIRLPRNESLRLRRIDCTLPFRDLPSALDGLSVLHFSDTHFSPSFTREFFTAVADEAQSMPSDLVLFTGDLLDDDATVDWIVPVFSRLHGRRGSFAILGNHDLDHHPARLVQGLEEAGFHELEGKWQTLAIGGTTIALGGTSYPWGPPLLMSDRPRADFRIVLSHSPDPFYDFSRAGIDLMLSGHNHGGQIRVPMIGAIFMPSRYSRRFDRGFFRRDDMTLHVSQGVAGKHPVRYGCVPEITRITLRAVTRSQRSDAPESAARFHGKEIPRARDSVR
jgi:predicted MPP superfamily phosphohydrolase